MIGALGCGSTALPDHSVEDSRRVGEGVGRIAAAVHCTDVKKLVQM